MRRPNQSLERGLDVVERLATEGPLSLARLHETLGIPKATLRRALATLEDRGFIRKSLTDGRYRARVQLPLLSSTAAIPPREGLISVLTAHAMTLTRETGLPADIHLREPQCMRILDSTRTISATRVFRGQIDRRVHLFGSAAGLACLSREDPQAVRALFHSAELPAIWAPRRLGLTWEGYADALRRAQELGYGWRLGRYLGESTLDDQLDAIAVPLVLDGRAVAALTLLYPRAMLTAAEFAERHLLALCAAVARARAELDRLKPQAPAPGSSAPSP